MTTPVWLTQNYMEEVLKLHHKDAALKIQNITIKPALAKGENYGGVLTKVKVAYCWGHEGSITTEKSLLVKSCYEEDKIALEKMQPYDIFNREMTIYDQVLPKLNQLLQEVNDTDKLFATALYTDYKRQALVFEDLSVQGYVMADRIERLDKDHMLLILRKLAKMHATSAVLNQREKGCLQGYDRGFFNKHTDTYKTYFVDTFMACARYLQKQPELECYARKIFTMEPYYMEIGLRCFQPIEGQVNVLAHGDVWTNNVMFKYDEETKRPLDVILIDFQYSFWGSPSLDLHHCFNTSLREPLRRQGQEELTQFYHHWFTTTLRKLKYSDNIIPSLKAFNIQMEQKRFFALHSALIIQAVMLNQDATDADFNALMGLDERSRNFKNRLYNNNPVIQENLKFLLPYFDHKGLLEVDQ
ncbi:uncharacterized protein LOC106080405 [Stomoxys calcitrans]|uniref:uncharacterized protein LOC106080405 n=1 Tax=Stomoxys calcitrans TaxID=35570 RepID=UPI0027E37D55|nr:uncharacterized protein LOC106080405 [Stomoxys calcitrans]